MTMRRTMAEMLRELRTELGMDPDVAVQANVLDQHKATLQRVQRLLVDNETWPHLYKDFRLDVLAGTKHPALPAGLSADRIQRVFARDVSVSGQRAYELKHQSFTEPSFTEEALSDDPDQTGWPIRAWRLSDESAVDAEDFTEVFSLWPAPDRNCQLTIYGYRDLAPFVDNTDRATLDSDLIVLQTASELLAEQNTELAQIKAAAAQTRKRDLLARSRGDQRSSASMLRR